MKPIHLILLLFIFSFCNCEYEDQRLAVRNTTKNDVYFYCSKRAQLDQLDSTYKNDLVKRYLIKFEPDSSSNIPKRGKNAWLEYIKEDPKNKMFIYISGRNPKRLKWNDVVKDKYFKCKKLYTFKELQKNNWMIEIDSNFCVD